MRFNTAAYDKAFPRKQNEEKIETVADRFTPTTDKLKTEPVTDPAADPVKSTDPVEPVDPVEPTDPDGGKDGD